MKMQQYFDECEAAYVQGDMTYTEIASRFPVAEKTVRLWSEQGNWKEKRKQFRVKRDSLHDKIYDFTSKLMDTIGKDWEQGNQVDPGRLYALCQLVGKLEKVMKYEGTVKQTDVTPDQPTAVDEAALAQRVREVLGIKA